MAMEYLLRSLLAAVMVSMCCAHCETQKGGRILQNVQKHKLIFEPGCWKGNTFYKLNNEWREEKCMKCSCSGDNLITCCLDVEKPVFKDSENCGIALNHEQCKYDVIQKDPRKSCEVDYYL
ncbi:beta-microseminoprotein A1-like [Pseudophryne corroboree]|uniref:beta-microseminoprotein A1-like n=1 Tax=Pseudophryne corroboree TaxID=495146 RepID=UPI00308126C5